MVPCEAVFAAVLWLCTMCAFDRFARWQGTCVGPFGEAAVAPKGAAGVAFEHVMIE